MPKCLSNIHIPDFTLNYSKFQLVSTRTYLGVIKDDDSKDNNDLYRHPKAIYARGNVLIKKFSLCNTDVNAKLFKTYCSAFYCGALWCHFDKLCHWKSFRILLIVLIFRKLFKCPCDCSISQTLLEYNIDNLIVTSKVDLSFQM